MTYTFKLARRLAVSRRFSMLPAILLFVACGGDATAPDGSTSNQPLGGWRPRAAVPTTVSINPSTVTIETNQLIRFLARGRNDAGDSVSAPVTWSATGGTILPDGRFSSALLGTFMVTATTTTVGDEPVDTSVVRVVRRQNLSSISISPETATLVPGVSQRFFATGYLKDGSAVPIGAIWSATGGTIDAGGNFTAGDTAGTYLVIASNTAKNLADTAIITITAPIPPPPPAPPTPTIASVTLLPGSATLAPSATRQFSAYGRTTEGDSVAVASVVFAATGGTITEDGLYTAGTTAGTYRVTASSTSGLADTSIVTVTQPLGSGPMMGVPFGPYALWADPTSIKTNAAAFSVSLNYSDASTIVTQIGSARTKGQKLVLGMTACCRAEYATDGNFTLSKWKLRQDRFNTAAIKAAVAAGVADGTIIGAKLLDEPEHHAWGTTLSKSVVDQMATYTKSLFPTLPVGVSHGPGGFRWRSTETYRVLDWVNYQYNWAVSGIGFAQGDAIGWRNAVLVQAAKDGVAPSFSLNLLDGGIQAARDGLWNCSTTLTQGRGTFDPNCRMTAAQLRTWAKALAPAGCMMLIWRYDDKYMSRLDNLAAFADVAQTLTGLPARSCRRP
jgi:hypothetical protein